MQHLKLIAALLITAPVVCHIQAANFTAGDLVVVRVGDGSTTLANSAGPISLLEYNSSGSLVQTAISIPSGNGGLQISGTATSEGQLVRNADGQSLTVVGYVPPFGGTGSLSGRSSANAPRGYVTIGYTGLVSPATTVSSSAYSGENIRSGFVTGSGAYFAGSGTTSTKGVTYDNGATITSITNINSRVLGYYNGNLYYSTGSGTQGIYAFSGTPNSTTASIPFLTGVTGQGTSPNDFTLSPDGNILYVADDGIGVQKFTFDGNTWSLAYNFDNGLTSSRAFGLAVDFNDTDPVIYWTSPTDIWTVTDTGSAATATSLVSAGANYAFRGLDFSPTVVPEPSSFALFGIGLAALLKLRNGKKQQ